MIEFVFDDDGRLKGACGRCKAGEWSAHMKELRRVVGGDR